MDDYHGKIACGRYYVNVSLTPYPSPGGRGKKYGR